MISVSQMKVRHGKAHLCRESRNRGVLYEKLCKGRNAEVAHINFYNEGTDEYKGNRGQEHDRCDNSDGFEHLDETM